MSDRYMTLIGTEEVTRAANNMQAAADSMRQTQGFMDESLRHFLARFEELVMRLEALAGPGKQDQQP